MKSRMRTIIVTAVCTTLFWYAVVIGVAWFSPDGWTGARMEFTHPVETEVFSGAYQVEVTASNSAATTLLLSHTARAPERVSFKIKRVDMETEQR
jgi:hypothetical protein